MIKSVTLSALLLAAAALPAQAQEIRVNVAGKSAKAVCTRHPADGPSPLELQLNTSCANKAFKAALADWQKTELAKARSEQLAAR
jgi:hypothetical protein